MNYLYKKLEGADVEIFKNLLGVFGEAFDEPDTYQSAIPSDAYLSSFLGKGHTIVIVALEGKMVVGGLVAYELEKFERERKEIYIYDLAVVEDHRRKGIATELIQQLRRESKIRGAYVIYVQADKDDEPAIRLYESLGIREDVFHFDIKV